MCRIPARFLRAALCLAGVTGAPLSADLVRDVIAQATVPEYQGYQRVLTGIEDVPGIPGFKLVNRYAPNAYARAAANWIKSNFTGSGLTTSEQGVPGYSPNIIGERRGTTRPDDIYILSANYDTYIESGSQSVAPAADGNGSGTAAMLMAARILGQYQFQGTVRFVAFAAKEHGLKGSRAYAQRCAGLGERIRGVINLDMLLYPGFDNLPGNPDYDLDIEADRWYSPALANYLADVFNQYTSIQTEVHRAVIGSGDQAAFWPYGFPAIGLHENTADEIAGGSNARYHTIEDGMDSPNYDWQFGLEAVRGGMAGMIGLAGLVPEPGNAVSLLMVVFLLGRARRAGG
ncbi:MAG: M28 family peptidase [Planctomycetota bacterium]